MKKYLVHIIYLMIITFTFIFANIKSAESQKSRLAAENAILRAEKMVDLVNQEASRAIKFAAEAEQLALALKKCGDR
jgi:hypothetical protein